MQNRIMLSPLCQYSSDNGHATAWHQAHIGGIVSRGPGLTCIEATSVNPTGRITPEDAGLWSDSQADALRPIVDFAHSQGQKIMIQIGHAGRKASTVAPWLSGGSLAPKDLGGWPDDVVGPSAIAWNEHHATPRAMTLSEIEDLKKAFASTIKRAVDIGFDAIELHGAHGYLIHEFLSPVSNTRTDAYGGSFENRTRLLLELAKQTRAQIPDSMPLFVRVSATDGLESHATIKDSWTVDQTSRLASLLADAGVDALDVSAAGNHPDQKISGKEAFQAPFAKEIKKAVGNKLLVGTVGGIKTGKIAETQIQDGLDFVAVGRWFQKDPDLVWTWAEELGIRVRIANLIRGAFEGRGANKGASFITEKL